MWTIPTASSRFTPRFTFDRFRSYNPKAECEGLILQNRTIVDAWCSEQDGSALSLTTNGLSLGPGPRIFERRNFTSLVPAGPTQSRLLPPQPPPPRTAPSARATSLPDLPRTQTSRPASSVGHHHPKLPGGQAGAVAVWGAKIADRDPRTPTSKPSWPAAISGRDLLLSAHRHSELEPL